MYTDQSELLTGLHQVLVEELGSRKTSNRSLTVADIYYELAPFLVCRNKLGIESVFDYERALVRLLAGEGGYLEIESLADRQKLQRRVDWRYPDPALLRDFLLAGVTICSSGMEETEGDDGTVDLPRFLDCPSCTEPLPQQAEVVFCPFCGDDLKRTSCVSCDEELRQNWRFCIACGTEVEAQGPPPGLH